MRLLFKLCFLFSALFVAGIVAAHQTGDDSHNMNTIHYSRIVDLSHEITQHIPLWPGDPPVNFKTVARFATDGYYLRSFSIGEHSATHMNAPNSFHKDGQGIDTYPADKLVVPAVVIGIVQKAAKNPDYALSVDDIKAWEAKHGKIPAGSMVLLYTGWEDKWDNPKAFFNQDSKGGLHFPGFAGAAATFLLQQRHVRGVGIDTHGVDPGQDETYATNMQVTARHGIVLENLTRLNRLPATGTTLVIGILRLKNGSGSPADIMAFVP